MAHDPAQRPDSAGDLVGRLTEILEPQVTARLRIPHAAPRPVPPMAGRSRIRQPVVASAAVAAAAAQEASAAGAAQEASAARAAQVDPSARPPQRDPAARAARAARAVRAAQAAQAARAARAQAARSPTARDRGEPPPDRDPPPAVVVARTGARGGQTRIPTRSRPSRSQWSLGAALLLAALAAVGNINVPLRVYRRVSHRMKILGDLHA